VVGEEIVLGFLVWLGRGILEALYWVWDIDFLPKLIRFPGTVIVECTIRTNRYEDERATLLEYVVGGVFWVAVLFGIYLLLR
jgi:hypothetical protein